MTISRFYICAIPATFWSSSVNAHQLNIGTLAVDALNCERRITKEVNLQDEYSRYTLICNQIEQKVSLSGLIQRIKKYEDFPEIIGAKRFPATVLPDGYISILSRLLENPLKGERLGASFFPPEQVAKHYEAFQRWSAQQELSNSPIIQQRLRFFENAANGKCGVVELQTSFMPAQVDDSLLMQYRGSQTEVEESTKYIEIPRFIVTDLDRELFGENSKKQRLLHTLIKQIQDALQNDEPVSFGNQAQHDVITEALNYFVYVPIDKPLKPTNLRIAYSDGSEAEPFPVFCLHRSGDTAVPAFSNPLKLSLMSMRHFELDPEIDFCWFRNKEVSKTRTLAETDDFCYKTTISQLDESLKQGDLLMYMYHTGFEPAVIGFYRGLVHQLMKLRKITTPSLRVIPMYFRGGDVYQEGKYWE